MSRQADADRVRLQLDLSAEAMQQLDEMKDEAGASSRAEVVRNAVRLYRWFLEKRRRGLGLCLREPGSNAVSDVELLF